MKRLIAISLSVIVIISAFAGCTDGRNGDDAPDSDDDSVSAITVISGDNPEPEPEVEIEPSSQESSDSGDQDNGNLATAQFRDGPNGTTTVTLAVGDSFLGLTLEYLDFGGDNDVSAKFTGEVILRGTIGVERTDGFMGRTVWFYVSDESLHLLPYYVKDSRTVWFVFDDNEGVKQMVGSDSFNFYCEIVIDSYRIRVLEAGVVNVASLVSVTPL